MPSLPPYGHRTKPRRRAFARTISTVIATAIAAALAFACGDDPAPEPPHTLCKPPPKPTGGVVLAAAAPFGDTTFTTPVDIVFGPGNRFYVVEQQGVIKVLPPGGGAPTVVFDVASRIVSGGEAGLLGLAFDPKFAENGFAYVYYTQDVDKKPDAVFQSIIARLTSKDGGNTFDPASEKLVLKVDQPFANHNGGHIAFGPDGMLYIGFGDGGSGGDPRGNGQNKDVLLGKMLRIDPMGASPPNPYGIPPTNPFANGASGRPEIYAYGLRNPWKWSFDKETGDLWCGDVGQSSFEEIDRIVLGGNYGWNIREGKHCYNATSCPSEGFIEPVAEYGRNEGISTSGGYVYRGKKLRSLAGKFIYGDFGSGNIWAVDALSSQPMLLTGSSLRISTFGQDGDGEVYVADYVGGQIKQLVPPDPVTPSDGAPGLRLTATGCIDPANPTVAPATAIPFTVASPLWSDGAQKDRWLFVPEGGKITVLPDGDFDVPVGSSAVKTFTVGGKKIETRLFVRYPDSSWAGFSYEWNDEGTEALLLDDSKTKPLATGGSWYFPSRGECFACHTQAAGFTLGLEARQLNHDGVLDRFESVLASPINRDAFPPLRAADTAGASSEERARGYLHSNCGVCHREGSGTGAATFDLRIDRALKDARICNASPQAGNLGLADAKIVAPGDPTKSILALRMRALDQNRMPPLASHVVDETGVAAIEQWIRETPACP